MKKILLCLQFFEKDKAIAMNLARLVADLEPEKSKHADFCFAARWDCQHDMDTVRYVGRKFSAIHTFQNERKSTGWPAGPNDLALEAYGRFCLRVRQGFWDYDAALFFEPDCVPLARDWIAQLQAEWYEKDQLVLGFMYGKNAHPIQHINGNCLISPLFQKKCRQFYASPSKVGWDVQHAKEMLRYGRASRLIWNDYARRQITSEELFDTKYYEEGHPLYGQPIQPCFFHGVKGGIGLEYVRNKFGL